MRVESLIVRVLIVLFFSCMYDPYVSIAQAMRAPESHLAALDPLVGSDPSMLDLDIVQRTCALYVAVRSAAFERPIAFGRDVDDEMVHWNKCPGGTMIACAVVPTADGDSIMTGLPLPH